VITIHDIFDSALFSKMLNEGYIRTQTNVDGSLTIANYSEKAQFAREWNDVTLNCRGLIFRTDTKEVVARGFKKFFNWDDSSQPYPPTGPCLRAPKMDGSLGILYWTGDDWKIATRGSFTSDQAIKATKMLREQAFLEPLEDKTYLFEIIYPENRIVVDYGQEEKLVLLDVLDTATGKADLAEFDTFEWPHKVEKISMPGFQDTMASDIPSGEEGFVFYWPVKDFRVKMKAAEYIELHRMIFGLSARSVWQRMGDGETVEEIAEMLPDEFHPWVKEIGEGLKREADALRHNILQENSRIASKMENQFSRKEFALKAVTSPHKAYLFMLLDGKDINAEIWKSLRPAGNIGVTTISEDVA
jgi:RNA ligase